MKFIIMTAVYVLIFGEIAGFKIVPFIARHVKIKKKNHRAIKKKKKNQPVRTRQFA